MHLIVYTLSLIHTVHVCVLCIGYLSRGSVVGLNPPGLQTSLGNFCISKFAIIVGAIQPSVLYVHGVKHVTHTPSHPSAAAAMHSWLPRRNNERRRQSSTGSLDCHSQQTSLHLHHVRVLSTCALTWALLIPPARALREIEPAYGPIRLTDLNSVGSKSRP